MYIRYISDTQLQTVWISSFIISRLPPLGWKAAAGMEHTAVLHSSLKASQKPCIQCVVQGGSTQGELETSFLQKHTLAFQNHIFYW